MRRAIVLLLGSAVCVLSATAGIASAGEPPITSTEVSTFSETFSDEPFLCHDELYTVSGSGHTVMHFTFFPDTRALHFHEVGIGKAVAVPLDGTGPSYTANFRDSDSENIRLVKNGDLLVEVDTDLHKAVAHGSDGSRVLFKEHAHFTVNANGEVSVDLHTFRLVCD